MTVLPLQIHTRALSPAERMLRSHRLVEQAARDLHTGDPGSGVKALAFAAATHLALTIGPDKAGAFFDMIAGVAREVRDEPEPAA
jgi:hypothetical protein